MNIKKTSLLLLAILLCTARIEAFSEGEGEYDRGNHSKGDTHDAVTDKNTSEAQLHAVQEHSDQYSRISADPTELDGPDLTASSPVKPSTKKQPYRDALLGRGTRRPLSTETDETPSSIDQLRDKIDSFSSNPEITEIARQIFNLNETTTLRPSLEQAARMLNSALEVQDPNLASLDANPASNYISAAKCYIEIIEKFSSSTPFFLTYKPLEAKLFELLARAQIARAPNQEAISSFQKAIPLIQEFIRQGSETSLGEITYKQSCCYTLIGQALSDIAEIESQNGLSLTEAKKLSLKKENKTNSIKNCKHALTHLEKASTLLNTKDARELHVRIAWSYIKLGMEYQEENLEQNKINQIEQEIARGNASAMTLATAVAACIYVSAKPPQQQSGTASAPNTEPQQRERETPSFTRTATILGRSTREDELLRDLVSALRECNIGCTIN